MSKSASAELLDHLEQPRTTTALLCRIKRKDGTVWGFTDRDVSITYDGDTYYPDRGGFLSTAVSTSSDLSVCSLDIDGVVDADAITRNDLLAGLYDGAILLMSVVNYNDLTMGSMALCPLSTLGGVKRQEPSGAIQVGVMGVSQGLTQPQGSTVCKECSLRFGSTLCGISAATYTVTGAVTHVASEAKREKFRDSSRGESADWFTRGELTWLTGSNAGKECAVVDYTSVGWFELLEPLAFDIQVGDTYSSIAGCDKRQETCETKWSTNNVLNFRGYGWKLPGRANYLSWPDKK